MKVLGSSLKYINSCLLGDNKSQCCFALFGQAQRSYYIIPLRSNIVGCLTKFYIPNIYINPA